MNNINKLRPFHLAISVDSLTAAREFYGGLLGCAEGRSNELWVDFNFFGHQLVVHLDTRADRVATALKNPVDGQGVPVPHFGLVMDMDDWADL
jgi:hypothetical protein